MAVSLKDKNRTLLALVVLANATLYLTTLNEGFAVGAWIETLTNMQKVVPVLLVSILTGIINAQIDHTNKARIVFWKWSHPLPGSRAFSEYSATDTRIDTDALRKYQDPLPSEPDKQNALWFKWYREFQNEPGILQAHREYLFTRDWAGISVLAILLLGPLAYWQFGNLQAWGIYIAILLAQYFLVRRAARNHGVRFVASVLSYKSVNENT